MMHLWKNIGKYLSTDATIIVSLYIFSTLQELYKGLHVQKDRLNMELIELKRCATPRPDWKRCGQYIEGGSERWDELSKGRTSDRMLNILLAQMAGIEESEVAKGDPFTGLVRQHQNIKIIVHFDLFVQGTAGDVPRHLRIDGIVKNRKLSLKEVNELINGFWHHRLNSSNEALFPVS